MDKLVPPEDLPDNPAGQEVPAEDMPGGMEVPASDLPDDEGKQEKYGTAGEQALTVGENVAKGFAGPLATLAEKGLSKGASALGFENIAQELSPEAQKARAEVNPIEAKTAEYGTLAGSFLTGAGEARVLMGAGHAAAEAAGFSGLGATLLKGLVEGGMIGAGDKMSEIINGDVDPEAPVASAISSLGGAALMGATTGAITGGLFDIGSSAASKGLRALSDTKAGNGAANFVQDLGNRWSFLKKSGSSTEAVTNELTNLHEAVNAASDATRGSSGLKSQAIDLLSQDVAPESVSKHVNDVSEMINKAPRAALASPTFMDAADKWKSATAPIVDSTNMFATPSPRSASEVFKATDKFKRDLADTLFDGRSSPEVTNGLRPVWKSLQGSLEDTGNWGKLGTLQSDLNKATSEFLPTLSDFNSKATLKVNDGLRRVNVVDADKIDNLMKGFSKGKKEIQKGILQDFTKAASSYVDEVNSLYHGLDMDSAIPNISLNETKRVLTGENSPGAQFADWLHSAGVDSFSTKISNTVVGAETGAKIGGLHGAAAGFALSKVLPFLENAIGRKINDYAVPAAIKALGSGKPEAIIEALNHADSVFKGQNAMQKGVNSLFTGAKIGAIKDTKDQEKIKKFIVNGGVNQQIQNQQIENAQSTPAPAPAQSFAHGGEVMGPSPVKDPDIKQKTNKLGEVFPAQDMLMNMAKGRVSNYLNSIKPQDHVQPLPFDNKLKNPAAEKKYDQAVSIAAKPLSILSHIQDGSLSPDHVKHMTSMWPEVHNQISKKMMEKVSEAQMKGEKPPYKIRQAMSLFMGGALDSSMTPASIQAAQASFMAKNAPQQPQQGKNKKGTSSLDKVAGNYRTADQSRQERQNKV